MPTLFFLPQYSPDLNPIETIWSELKADLREYEARSFDTICEVLVTAFDAITSEHATNRFINCHCKT